MATANLGLYSCTVRYREGMPYAAESYSQRWRTLSLRGVSRHLAGDISTRRLAGGCNAAGRSRSHSKNEDSSRANRPHTFDTLSEDARRYFSAKYPDCTPMHRVARIGDQHMAKGTSCLALRQHRYTNPSCYAGEAYRIAEVGEILVEGRGCEQRQQIILRAGHRKGWRYKLV